MIYSGSPSYSHPLRLSGRSCGRLYLLHVVCIVLNLLVVIHPLFVVVVVGWLVVAVVEQLALAVLCLERCFLSRNDLSQDFVLAGQHFGASVWRGWGIDWVPGVLFVTFVMSA